MHLVAGTYERFLFGIRVGGGGGGGGGGRGDGDDGAPPPTATLAKAFSVPAHSGPVRCVAAAGPYVVTGGSDDQLHVYTLGASGGGDKEQDEERDERGGGNKKRKGAAAAGPVPPSSSLQSAPPRDHGFLVNPGEGAITCAEFVVPPGQARPRPTHLLTGGADGAVAVWRAGGGWEHLKLMKGGGGGGGGDGAGGGGGGGGRTTDYGGGGGGKRTSAAPAGAPGAAINALAVHPSARLALSAGHDRAVRLWDLSRGRCAYSARCEVAPCAARFSADGLRYALAAGCGVTVHEVSGPLVATLGHARRVTAVMGPGGVGVSGGGGQEGSPSSSSCSLVLTGGEDGAVRLWDLRVPASAGPVASAERAHATRVRGLVAMPRTGGRRGDDGGGDSAASAALALLPAGAFASASSDGAVRLWDARLMSRGGAAACVASAETGARITGVALSAPEVRVPAWAGTAAVGGGRSAAAAAAEEAAADEADGGAERRRLAKLEARDAKKAKAELKLAREQKAQKQAQQQALKQQQQQKQQQQHQQQQQQEPKQPRRPSEPERRRAAEQALAARESAVSDALAAAVEVPSHVKQPKVLLANQQQQPRKQQQQQQQGRKQQQQQQQKQPERGAQKTAGGGGGGGYHSSSGDDDDGSGGQGPFAGGGELLVPRVRTRVVQSSKVRRKKEKRAEAAAQDGGRKKGGAGGGSGGVPRGAGAGDDEALEREEMVEGLERDLAAERLRQRKVMKKIRVAAKAQAADDDDDDEDGF